MTLDDTRMKEAVALLEEIFDQEKEKADAMGTYNVRIRDAKNTLTQWAQGHEIDPANILAIYDQYKKARSGKITWTAEDQDYGDLLFSLMEMALTK